MSLELERVTATCAFCQRTEIETVKQINYIEIPEAPAIGVSVNRMCEDCLTILSYAIRIGALALRRELTNMRQLDLFEEPKDRVFRLLRSLEGTDAPST